MASIYENGKLVDAIKEMKRDNSFQNQEHFIQLLCDATFIVPIAASEEDIKKKRNLDYVLKRNSEVQFPSLANENQEHYFIIFTSKAEAEKWEETPHTQFIEMGYYRVIEILHRLEASYVGLVMDPFGTNFTLENDTIRAINHAIIFGLKGKKRSKSVQAPTGETYLMGSPDHLPQDFLDGMLAFCKEQKGIQKAYFSLIFERPYEKYLIVLDYTGEDKDIYRKTTNKVLEYIKDIYRVRVLPSSDTLGQQAINAVEPFYVREEA